MLVIPGRPVHTCDGVSRRDFLRVGSLGLFGVSLSSTLALQKVQASTSALTGMKGFGSAKSVILLFLQGGPSHIDIWTRNRMPPPISAASSRQSRPGCQASG